LVGVEPLSSLTSSALMWSLEKMTLVIVRFTASLPRRKEA